MESGMSSPFQTHSIKKISGIFFYITLDFPWNMWNAIYEFFRKAPRKISMLPLIETIWNKWSGKLFEFNLIYIQGYTFSWGKCTCTGVWIGIVFFPTHWHMSQNSLRVSFNTLILRKRIKIIHNRFLF